MTDTGITTLSKMKISDVKIMTIAKGKSFQTTKRLTRSPFTRSKQKFTIPGTKQARTTKIQVRENKKTGLMTLLQNNNIPSFYSDYYNNL